jgi:Carboxypeptidase regulatory-like domain
MLITKKTVQTAAIGVLMFCCVSVPLLAQTYTLSGKVSDVSAHPVASATVTAKRLATGKVFSAQTNSDGVYSILDLAGGDYEVSAVAGELQAPAVKVTLAAAQTTDLTVSPASKQ